MDNNVSPSLVEIARCLGDRLADLGFRFPVFFGVLTNVHSEQDLHLLAKAANSSVRI